MGSFYLYQQDQWQLTEMLVSGVILSNFNQAYNGGSVELTVDVTG